MGSCASAPAGAAAASGPPVKVVEAPTPPRARPSPSKYRQRPRETTVAPEETRPKRRKSVRFGQEEDGGSSSQPEQYPNQQYPSSGDTEETGLSEIELARQKIHQLCQGSNSKKTRANQSKYKYYGKANSVPGREHVRLWLMTREGEHQPNQIMSSASRSFHSRAVNAQDSDNDCDDSYAAFEQWKKTQPQSAEMDEEADEVQKFDQFYSWKRNRIERRQRQAQAYEEFVSWESSNKPSKPPPMDPLVFDEVMTWQRAAESLGITQSLDEFVTWQRNNDRPQTALNLTSEEYDEIISWRRTRPKAETHDDYVTWQRNSQAQSAPVPPEVFQEILQRQESGSECNASDTASIQLETFEEVVRWQRSQSKSSPSNLNALYDDFVTWQRHQPAAKTTGVVKIEPDVFQEIVSWQRSQPKTSRGHDYVAFAKRGSTTMSSDVSERVRSWQRNRQASKPSIEARASPMPDDLDVYLEFKDSHSNQSQAAGNDVPPGHVDSFVQWKRNKASCKSSAAMDSTINTASFEPDDLEIFVEWRRANNKSNPQRPDNSHGTDDLLEYVTWQHNRTKAKTADKRSEEASVAASLSDCADDELVAYLSWERSRSTAPAASHHYNSADQNTGAVSDELWEYAQWKRSVQPKKTKIAPESINDENDALRYVLWQRNRATSGSPPSKDSKTQSERPHVPDNELLDYVQWQRSRRKDFLSQSNQLALGKDAEPETELFDYLHWKRTNNPSPQPRSTVAEALPPVDASSLGDDIDEYMVWKRKTEKWRVSTTQLNDDDGTAWLDESLSSTKKKKERIRSADSTVSELSIASFSASEMFESAVSVYETESRQSFRSDDGDIDEDAMSWLQESLSSMPKRRQQKKRESNPAAQMSGRSENFAQEHSPGIDASDEDQAKWLSESLSSLSKKRKKKANTSALTVEDDTKSEQTCDEVVDSVIPHLTADETMSANADPVESASLERDRRVDSIKFDGERDREVDDAVNVIAESVDQPTHAPTTSAEVTDLPASKRPTIKKKSKSITQSGLTLEELPKGKKTKRSSLRVGDGPAISVPKRWSMPVKKETMKDKFFKLLSKDHRSDAETREIQDMIRSNPELCQESFSFEGIAGGINPLSRLCIIHAPLEAVMMCYMAYPSAIKLFDQVGTPLHYAAKSATPTDVMSFLISKRALMVQTLNMERLAPLHYACMSKAAPETIHLLLEHYPSAVQLQDKHGQSPLHLACANGSDLGIIEQLVQAFPEACISENKDGQTPLHLALQNESSFDIIEALVVSQFDAVKVADDNGNLPLHIAAMTQATKETIQMLINHYKEGRKAKNRAKQRPLDLVQIHRPDEEDLHELFMVRGK